MIWCFVRLKSLHFVVLVLLIFHQKKCMINDHTLLNLQGLTGIVISITTFSHTHWTVGSHTDALFKLIPRHLQMSRTQKNKATAHHLGLLKARLAKLRRELITPKGGSGGGAGDGQTLVFKYCMAKELKQDYCYFKAFTCPGNHHGDCVIWVPVSFSLSFRLWCSKNRGCPCWVCGVPFSGKVYPAE